MKIKVNTKEHKFVLEIALTLDWVTYLYLRELSSDPKDSFAEWAD